MGTDQWYYARNGQKFGPLDSAALKQLAYSGGLAVSDMVWREGMTEWALASKVNGLFPESVLAATPPPLPSTALAAANSPPSNLDERYNSIYRSSDEKVLLGVAGGLAHKFGLPLGVVRVAIVISAFFWVGWFYFAGFFLPKLPTKGVPRPA